MLEHNQAELPISRQCRLLGLRRSTAYYASHRSPERQAAEVLLMHKIDELYTAHPNLGRNGMRDALAESFGLAVNAKRVRRLMKVLCLAAVYPRPKRNTSKSTREHRKYPYLLGNLQISRPDHVWCSDITYIRLKQGFVYLTAVMDWYSRAVLSWELSTSLESVFCVDALESALELKRLPEIFNTDQGSQYTSEDFTSVLKKRGISISMDGAGRAFDNIMIERLWRTVKYEEVYLRDYSSVLEARMSLARYFDYYNHHRRHSSLQRNTPARVYGLQIRFDRGWRKDKLANDGADVGAASSSFFSLALRAPFKKLLLAAGTGITP